MPGAKNSKLKFAKTIDNDSRIDRIEEVDKPDFGPYTNSFDRNQIKKLKMYAIQQDKKVKDLLHEALAEYIEKYIRM